MKNKRRHQVTGSLFERNGYYTAILNLYDENGKRKQKSIALNLPVQGNKRKAQTMLDELKQQYTIKSMAPGQKAEYILFSDFLQDWLKITAPTIAKATYQGYQNAIDTRLDPFFRSRQIYLNEVKPYHIRELHESIFRDGCKATTVIKYHGIVRKALQYAVKNEYITENPADKVDRPKINKYLASFYSKTELMTLFEATKDDIMSIVIQLAAYYGLRRSETIGLRWSAIDFEHNTISINHNVTELTIDGEHKLFMEDKLKTKSSFRTMPLIPVIRDLLLKHREKQKYYQLLFKSSYCQEYLDYVCVNEMGELIKPKYVSKHFKALLEKNHLRPIRFHDLRHSCASLLLSEGIPMKQIQDWLGHSTFSTTADIYVHLDYQSKWESANAIANAFAIAGEKEAPIINEMPSNFDMRMEM